MTELIPSGAPMVFGAAAVASRAAPGRQAAPSIVERNHDAWWAEGAVASGEPLQGNEMQFPSSVAVVMRRRGE